MTTPYPPLRLKLTMPAALKLQLVPAAFKLQFIPAIPGVNSSNKVDRSGDTMTGPLTVPFINFPAQIVAPQPGPATNNGRIYTKAVGSRQHLFLQDGVGEVDLSLASSGGITGSGTDNHIVRWDGSAAIQDS